MPNTPITREEVATIVGITFGLSKDESESAKYFLDEYEIALEAKGYISILKDKGYISGYPDGTFKPSGLITRAEVAKMINNISGEIINTAGSITKDVEGNLLINTADVILKDMQIKGDLYLTEGIGDGDVTLDNVVVKGETYIRGGGENSVIIKDSTLGRITIDRSGGNVRVIIEGNISIDEIILEDNAILVVREGATVGVVHAVGKATIQVDKGATIKELEVNGKEVDVKSEGKIDLVVANERLKVNGETISKGTEAKVKDGKVEEIKEEPKKDSGSSGGSSGGGGNSNPEPVLVSAISVTGAAGLVKGETLQMGVDITPTKATNQKVTWSVETLKDGVATIDQNGVLTATTTGTVTVKATAKDGSGKVGSKVVTIADVMVTTPEELTTALGNGSINNVILVRGTLGKADNGYTVYTIEKQNVIVRGMDGAKVFGTFIVREDGVTIDNLAIQNKGDLGNASTQNRGAIYLYANSGTITNNYITNGLGNNQGLSNGIQIMRKSQDVNASTSAYTIKGNTLIGHIQGVPNWSSSGIVVTENNSSGTAGGPYYGILVDDYAIATENTFTNNQIDYVHQDWSESGTKGTTKYALVSNDEQLKDEIGNAREKATILVSGTLGEADNGYTVYTIDKKDVIIRGMVDAKVFGTFIVKADDVTIDNLAIQNKGDLTGESSTNRGGIYVYAKNVTLTNNTITNGLGENAGLSNAIQIMSPAEGNSLSNYVITGNKITGHIQGVPNWSSSGIVIAQGYSPGSIGKYVEAITALAVDYESLLTNNIFENNKINLTHQDWSKPKDEVVLYEHPVPVDETKADVANLGELIAALADENIKTINVTSDIAATAPVVVNREVTINGGSKTLSFTGLEAITDPNKVDDGLIIQAAATINNLKVDAGLATPSTWVGTYAIHVYNTTATLNDVTATKGNGGILVNGSAVTLTGAIDVTGNGFGGIEVSVGTELQRASLDVTEANLNNNSEAYGLPTIWEDGVDDTVKANEGQFTRNDFVKDTQTQYYLKDENAVEPNKAAFLVAAKSYKPESTIYDYSFDGKDLTIDFNFVNLTTPAEITMAVQGAAGAFLEAVFATDKGNASEVVINMNGQKITLTSGNETENIGALAGVVFNTKDADELFQKVTAFVTTKEAVIADFTMTVTVGEDDDAVTFTLDGLKATFNNVTTAS